MGEPEVGSLVAVVEGVVVVVEGHHLHEGDDRGLGVAGHEDVLDLRTDLEKFYFCAMNESVFPGQGKIGGYCSG